MASDGALVEVTRDVAYLKNTVGEINQTLRILKYDNGVDMCYQGRMINSLGINVDGWYYRKSDNNITKGMDCIDPRISNKLSSLQLQIMQLQNEIKEVSNTLVDTETSISDLASEVYTNANLATNLENELINHDKLSSVKKLWEATGKGIATVETIGHGCEWFGSNLATWYPPCAPFVLPIAGIGKALSAIADIGKKIHDNAIIKTISRGYNTFNTIYKSFIRVKEHAQLTMSSEQMDLNSLHLAIMQGTAMINNANSSLACITEQQDEAEWYYYLSPLFGNSISEKIVRDYFGRHSDTLKNQLPNTHLTFAHGFVIFVQQVSRTRRFRLIVSTGSLSRGKEDLKSLLAGVFLQKTLFQYIQVEEYKLLGGVPDVNGVWQDLPSRILRGDQLRSYLGEFAADRDIGDAVSVNFGQCELPINLITTFCSLKSYYDKRPYHILKNNCQSQSLEVIRFATENVKPGWWNKMCDLRMLKGWIEYNTLQYNAPNPTYNGLTENNHFVHTAKGTTNAMNYYAHDSTSSFVINADWNGFYEAVEKNLPQTEKSVTGEADYSHYSITARQWDL